IGVIFLGKPPGVVNTGIMKRDRVHYWGGHPAGPASFSGTSVKRRDRHHKRPHDAGTSLTLGPAGWRDRHHFPGTASKGGTGIINHPTAPAPAPSVASWQCRAA